MSERRKQMYKAQIEKLENSLIAKMSDILSEKEVPMAEPIDLDFSDEVKAQFMVTTDEDGYINLKTTVFENNGQQFEENIRETVHDEKKICDLLLKAGFQLIKCDHHLLENEGNHSATWYIIAKK